VFNVGQWVDERAELVVNGDVQFGSLALRVAPGCGAATNATPSGGAVEGAVEALPGIGATPNGR
jgi:hypothetical protein